MKGSGLAWGLGLTATGLALLFLLDADDRPPRAAPRPAPMPPPAPPVSPPPGADWRYRVIRSIAAHEGDPASVQRNLDGNGVSFGILQWTQRGGGLAVLLRALHQREPARVEAVFGGPASWGRLQAHVDAKSLAPLDNALLWNPPWLDRFHAAGRDPVLASLQWIIAAESDYIRAIPAIAGALGVRSERAYALIGNRTVHQGVGGVWQAVRSLRAWWSSGGGAPAAEPERLSAFAWTCAAAFRMELYEMAHPRGHWRWVEPEHILTAAGTVATRSAGAWHAFSGPWDLWELIVQRSAQILADPQWSDGPV